GGPALLPGGTGRPIATSTASKARHPSRQWLITRVSPSRRWSAARRGGGGGLRRHRGVVGQRVEERPGLVGVPLEDRCPVGGLAETPDRDRGGGALSGGDAVHGEGQAREVPDVVAPVDQERAGSVEDQGEQANRVEEDLGTGGLLGQRGEELALPLDPIEVAARGCARTPGLAGRRGSGTRPAGRDWPSGPASVPRRRCPH